MRDVAYRYLDTGKTISEQDPLAWDQVVAKVSALPSSHTALEAKSTLSTNICPVDSTTPRIATLRRSLACKEIFKIMAGPLLCQAARGDAQTRRCQQTAVHATVEYRGEKIHYEHPAHIVQCRFVTPAAACPAGMLGRASTVCHSAPST